MSNESRAKFEEWYLAQIWAVNDDASKDDMYLVWKSLQSEIDSLRAENERLKKVDDGIDRLITILNRKGHDHLTFDYLLKATGKSAT